MLHGLIAKFRLRHAGDALIDEDHGGLVGVPCDVFAHDRGGQGEIALDGIRGLALREGERDEIHHGEVGALVEDLRHGIEPFGDVPDVGIEREVAAGEGFIGLRLPDLLRIDAASGEVVDVLDDL